MKIIDLLNKIANGEIDYTTKFDAKVNMGYCGINEYFERYPINENYLNCEIELELLEEEPRDIEVCGSLFTKSEYDKLVHNKEEKKIPEKLFFTHISNYNDQSVVNNNFNNYFKKTQETINQLIDYLKSKGDE